MITKTQILIATCSILSGCSREPEADTPMLVTPVTTSARITVTRIGIIDDPLAYGDRRGVYIITDTKTGMEYIGVSGIGISELGSHSRSTGKGAIIVGDER